MWQLDYVCATAFIAYGSIVGARFILYRTVEADKMSCKYYSMWLCLHHLFPAYWHYFHGVNDYPTIDLLDKLLA
ncbi:hypothetical protein ID866_4811 [Astraeus odoratus]|nr:hypothetical protein ID866_4811 [Astraeus odoratus]